MAPFDTGIQTPELDDRTQRTLSAVDPLLNLAEGALLGRYRIERQLNSGGMGILYVARHDQIGKRVALKVLNPIFNQEPDFVRRFFNEARAVNRIKNEHIVEIYDCVQQPNGLNYLVMELLEGADLWKIRETEGPLAMARILRIARQTATALKVAHAKGIIHRDLKPENVFLVPQGRRPELVKLLDFGIAKLAETGRQHTKTGLVMGTPGFMAPEQALGAPMDARVDVYAFGVMLCWMLTGKLPSESDRLPPLDARGQGPDVVGTTSEAGEPIPESLRALVKSALVFNREQRLGSMVDVLRMLDGRQPRRATEMLTPAELQEVQGLDAGARHGAARRSKLLMTLGLGCIAVLAGVLAWRALPSLLHSLQPAVLVPSVKPVDLPLPPLHEDSTAVPPASPVRPGAAATHRRRVKPNGRGYIPAGDPVDRPLGNQSGPKPKPTDPLDSRDGTEEWQ